MAGLFSKKNKKDQKERDDNSSTNSSTTNARHPGRPSNGSHNSHPIDSQRDSSSANNSITHSHSDYSQSQSQSHSPYSQQHHQQQQQLPYAVHDLPAYASKTSLQQQQQQLHYHNSSNMNSATSFSTHQSALTNNKQGQGPWTSGIVMSTNPFPRFAHTASFVTTGTDIYVFGGIVKGSPMRDVHVIDPHFGGKDAKGKTSDTLYVLHTGRKQWAKPSIQTLLPAPRHSHAACVVGTVMYIMGGQLSGYYMNDIAAFDMKTLNGKHPTWTVLEPKSELPPARAGHCAAAFDGRIYIFGGADDKYYYNDIWCYTPQTNTWMAIPAYGTLPASRQGHTAAVINDTMYIYGGMDFEDKLLGDFCAFNFTERRWLTFPITLDAPSPRTEHAMCCVGEKLYILGGQLDLNANEDAGMIFVLDTAKIRWNDSSMSASVGHESMQRAGSAGHDGRGSPYNRPTPTPDSSRMHNGHDQNALHTRDSKRATYQPELHQEHPDQNVNQSQHQDQQQQQQRFYTGDANGPRTGPAIKDDSHQQGNSGSYQRPHSQSPLPASSVSHQNLDTGESSHAARRRTIGKPVGYGVQDVEPRRGAHSIDGGRRAGPGFDSEFGDHASSSQQQQTRPSSVQRQVSSIQDQNQAYSELDDRAYSPQHHQQQQQQRQQGERGHLYSNNGNGSNTHLASRSNPSLQQQYSHLDLTRQASNATNSTIADSLHRQGSVADSSLNRVSYTSISNLQPTARSSFDPSLRVPLRVTNPDGGESIIDQDTDAAAEASSVSSSSKTGTLKEAKELQDLKQREQWLLAEVSMARKKMGERPLSMAILALEDELQACEVDSEKYRIMQALLNVKAELERSKTSIATQAQIASNKVREAERVRTSALQEAAYLKAKMNALQTGETSALVATETARATDLEKRLMAALAQLDQYEVQFVQYETILEHERESRMAAEAREQEASSRAEEAQLAHTRALNDVTTLHERATIAESSLRETVAKSASSEAGLSSYQQQSAALLSQISALKTTVDHQKKSLEKTKLAYTVANERAEQADKMWTQSRQEMDEIQLELSSVRADMDRAQRQAEHWRTKAGETELLWQKAKKENENMRTLLEEDMNSAAFATSSPSMSKERKHDSIMAITSASRQAELEHELGTLRQLLKESQEAATQANKDLGDTMIRNSQLEQTSMTARAEAATAQRKLTEARDKVALLQAQLIQRQETVEEMVREQENNEVQLGLLRGVMKEHGLLADDLILGAKDQNGENNEGKGGASSLKVKTQKAERRATEAESQLKELKRVKKQQEQRIQQLESDYQTAVQYVQSTESTLQRLQEEASAFQSEKESLEANLQQLESEHSRCSSRTRHHLNDDSAVDLEEEVAELHRQLNAAHERAINLESEVDSLSVQLHSKESKAEIELQSLKAQQQEHKKRGGVNSTMDQFQSRIEQLEQSLKDTRHRLDETLEDLDHAHELNRVTGQELEDALDALKRQQTASATGGDSRSKTMTPNGHGKRQDDLEHAIDHAHRTIQSLQQSNRDLEEQLRASENKISLLLDNFQGPESVRNSVASLSGLTGLHGLSISPPSSASMMPGAGSGSGSGSGLAAAGLRSHLNSPPASISARSMSPASPSFAKGHHSRSGSGHGHNGSTGGGSAGGDGGRTLTNSQKLEEYEKLIDEMTIARRQYEE
ncbi:Negative regulator of mitotic exit [Mortierella claussenii]|nr:Negative regulator of mitotic exit [Mortierella claussenii]